MTWQGFISYGHDDYKAFTEIRKHLRQIERNYKNFTIWSDERIGAGDYWRDEIQEKIDKSNVFFILYSKNFYGANYVFDSELPEIRRKIASQNSTIVLPIVLDGCLLPRDVNELNAVPRQNGRYKPIYDWKPVRHGYEAMMVAIQTKLVATLGLEPAPHVGGPA